MTMHAKEAADSAIFQRQACARLPVRSAALIATLTGSLLWPAAPTAMATTLARIDLGRLTAHAAVVARVRCSAVAARADARGIWTLSTFEVLETWKGNLSGRFVVRLPGGNAAGRRETVEGVPRFAESDEAVLFLEPLASGDWTIVGWVQGTYRIRRDSQSGTERAVPDSAGLLLLDTRSQAFRPSAQHAILLADLKAQVAALAAGGAR